MPTWLRRAGTVVLFWTFVWLLGSQALPLLHPPAVTRPVEVNQAVESTGAEDRLADYTLWLTIFTGVLGGSTLLLWLAGERQGRLARQEFIASHRPRLRVRRVVTPVMSDHYAKAAAGDAEQKMRWVFLDLANIGDSDATITELLCDFGVPPDPDNWALFDPPPVFTARVSPAVPLSLKVGEQQRFEVTSATLQLSGSRTGVELYGRIRYEDANGVARVTGFRRIWDVSQGDYNPSSYPGEEYED